MTDALDWKAAYDALLRTYPTRRARPVVGITGNFGDRGCELAEGYFRSVLEAGGVPLVIPPYGDTEALLATLDRIDGLLLSGGGDINPLCLGEEPSPALHSINPRRDVPELLLTRLAYDRQIPILGICRGIQVLAAALGWAWKTERWPFAKKACAPAAAAQPAATRTAEITIRITGIIFFIVINPLYFNAGKALNFLSISFIVPL